MVVRSGPRAPCSSVAQRQSIRLLTGGLLVRIQPEEPAFARLGSHASYGWQALFDFMSLSESRSLAHFRSEGCRAVAAKAAKAEGGPTAIVANLRLHTS